MNPDHHPFSVFPLASMDDLPDEVMKRLDVAEFGVDLADDEFESLIHIQKAEELVSDVSGPYVAKKGDWIVEGVVATSDLDFHDQIVEETALDDLVASFQTLRTVLFNNDPREPIGAILTAERVPNGVFVRSRISKTASKRWEQVKDGTLGKFSFRAGVLDASRDLDSTTGKMVWRLHHLVGKEVSLVPVPGNMRADVIRFYVQKAMQTAYEKGGDNVDLNTALPDDAVDIQKMDQPQMAQRMTTLLDRIQTAAGTNADIRRAVNEIRRMHTSGAMTSGLKVEDITNGLKGVLPLDDITKALALSIDGGSSTKTSVEGLVAQVTALNTTLAEVKKSLDGVPGQIAAVQELVAKGIPNRKGISGGSETPPNGDKSLTDIMKSDEFQGLDPYERLHLMVGAAEGRIKR